MKKSLISIFAILFLLLADVNLLFAQNGGFASAGSRIGFSSRGMSMGNAMTANTSQGKFAYYNPAIAALDQSNSQLDLSVGSLSFDRIHQTIGFAVKLPPKAGISFTLIRSGLTDIDGRTSSGYQTGSFDASEYQLGTAFGIQISNKLNLGIGFKLNLANYNPDLSSQTAVGLDIGTLYHINEKMNFGFAVQDLLAEYSWNSASLYNVGQSRNIVNKFPTRVKFGLAYQEEVFSVSADYEIQAYSSEVINTERLFIDGLLTTFENQELINTSSTQFRMGGSWNAHERFTLRSGFNIPDLQDTNSWGLSSGFSVHLPFDALSPSIDYAFVLEPNRIAKMHVFALRLHL